MTGPARIFVVLALSALATWIGYVAGARSDARVAPTSVAPPSTIPAPVVAKPVQASSAAANFAGRIPELTQRADAGDRDAARALADGLARCQQLRAVEEAAISDERFLDEMRKRHAAHGTDTRSSQSDLLIAHRVEAARAQFVSTQADCAGVSRDQIRSLSHWLYEAARLGDTKSALEFGVGTFLETDMLGQLEQVPFWRDHAEEMLQRALAGGEVHALQALANAHDPMEQYAIPKLASDPVAAYTYYTVMSLLPGAQNDLADYGLERLDPQMTDTDRDEALARAADICLNDLPTICSLPASSAP
jgi:hypothetical protein